MEKHHQKALTTGLQDLIDNIEIAKVEVTLLEGEIFSDDDFREINMKDREEHKVRKLVEMLKKRGPNAYPTFMRALKKHAIYNHLVLKLEELATKAMEEDKNKGSYQVILTTMAGAAGGNIMTAAEQNRILQYLSKQITREWTFVGLNLQIPQGTIDQIRMNNQGNQQLINHTMLSEWLRTGQDKSKQFLATALLEAGRRDLHDWVLEQN